MKLLPARARLALRALLKPEDVEEEIDDEIRLHLDLRTRDYRARGHPEDEARELARERFGDLSAVTLHCRRLAMVERTKGRPTPMSLVSLLLRELRHSLRSLAKTPGATAVVLVTLALGIGANAAIFSIVEGVVLRPLPYHDPDRLLRLWENDRLRGTSQEGFSLPDYFDVRDRNEVFQSMAAFTSLSGTWTSKDAEPTRLRAIRVSSSLTEVLGRVPVLGRGFRPDEDLAGGEPVAVLGHRLWLGRFGASPEAVGSRIELDGISRRIVGVMPPRFDFPRSDVELYLPFEAGPSPSRGNHGVGVVARMREGVSLEQANAQLKAIAAALEAEFADDNLGRGMWAETLYRSMVGEARDGLLLLFGAVGFLLLVACVNVAGIRYSRALARERERAIQTALGASRLALVRQQLLESLLLSLAGAALALGVSALVSRGLLALAPGDLPRSENVGTNGLVLGFTFVLSLAAALAFGVLPAISGSRMSLRGSLHEGSAAAGTGRSANRLRRALLVAEISLAVVLVFGAGLLIGSFVRLLRVDPGFSAQNVVSASIDLPASRYPQRFSEWPKWNEVRAFQTELLSMLSAAPGIDSAAIAINTPLDPGWTSRFEIEGRPEVAPGEQDEVRVRVVSPRYFRTVGLPIVHGRDLTADDERAEAPPVLLVNEAFVRRYFQEEEPLGARLTQWDVTYEVVGVVRDEKFLGLAAEVPPAIYPTFQRAPFSGFYLLARSREPEERVLESIRRAVRDLDPALAVADFTTLEERIAQSVAEPRFTTILFASFAALALGLAAVGIYGLMSQAVSQRTREIGVRMSLGARPRDVVALVLADGGRLAAIGIGAGVVLSIAVSRAFESFLFGVEKLDPATLAAVVLVSAAAGLLAAYLPARRASRLDPIATLRQD